MNKRTFSKRHIAENILLALKGALVGFGAIMPGISGGTLCVAFGMYQPLIEVFSHPRQALQKHWLSLCVFLFGAGIGFIGLSGLAGWLLEQNSQAVTCAFIGLIVGTIPELWRDAGQKGRRPSAYFAMVPRHDRHCRRNCNHDFTGAQRERCKNRPQLGLLGSRRRRLLCRRPGLSKAFTAVTGTHLPSNKKLWGGAKQPLPTFFIPVSVLLHFFFPLLAVSIACR